MAAGANRGLPSLCRPPGVRPGVSSSPRTDTCTSCSAYTTYARTQDTRHKWTENTDQHVLTFQGIAGNLAGVDSDEHRGLSLLLSGLGGGGGRHGGGGDTGAAGAAGAALDDSELGGCCWCAGRGRQLPGLCTGG